MSVPEFVTSVQSVSISNYVVSEIRNAADNSFICYVYNGFDIYVAQYVHEGKQYNVYCWNHVTQNEYFGYATVEDAIAFINEYNS